MRNDTIEHIVENISKVQNSVKKKEDVLRICKKIIQKVKNIHMIID